MDWTKLGTLIVCGAVMVGCSQKTEKMGRTRPPVDELSNGGRGLQGKDVISASDQMAQDLLSSPVINESRDQLTIVVDRVENLTQTQRFNMDIFLQRLKVNIAKHGRGRVQLIENRDKLRELQSRELEQPGSTFGQGGVNGKPGPAGIQPDFALYAKVSELPNSETSYFLLEFTLTKIGGEGARRSVWSNMYEVTTYR